MANILKAEGVEVLVAFPHQTLIETAALAGIRPIICRQERAGVNMADGYSRVTNGRKIGIFSMQRGPGAENAFGGVAQAYGESSPIVVLPMGYPRNLANVDPNFSSALNYRHVTKSCEQLLMPDATVALMRRAFHAVRNGQVDPLLIPITPVSDEFIGSIPRRNDERNIQVVDRQEA